MNRKTIRFKLCLLYIAIIAVAVLTDSTKTSGQSVTNMTREEEIWKWSRESRLTHSNDLKKISQMTASQLAGVMKETFPDDILFSEITNNQSYELKGYNTDLIGDYLYNLKDHQKRDRIHYQLTRRLLAAMWLVETNPKKFFDHLETRSSDESVSLLDCLIFDAPTSENAWDFIKATTSTIRDRSRWRALLFSKNAVCRSFAAHYIDDWLQPDDVADVVKQALTDELMYVRSNVIDYLERKKPGVCKEILKEYINRKPRAVLREKDAESEKWLNEYATKVFHSL